MSRALLPAAVPPMVAVWISGRYGDEMREAAELYVRRGMPDVARQFLVTLGQLHAAAAQLSNDAFAAAVTSDSGNEETEIGPVLASSVLTTAQAAERLGRTARCVVQLLNKGELSGRKVGRAWLVDPGSVDDVLEARRAA